jgi:hypothetical protein
MLCAVFYRSDDTQPWAFVDFYSGHAADAPGALISTAGQACVCPMNDAHTFKLSQAVRVVASEAVCVDDQPPVYVEQPALDDPPA